MPFQFIVESLIASSRRWERPVVEALLEAAFEPGVHLPLAWRLLDDAVAHGLADAFADGTWPEEFFARAVNASTCMISTGMFRAIPVEFCSRDLCRRALVGRAREFSPTANLRLMPLVPPEIARDFSFLADVLGAMLEQSRYLGHLECLPWDDLGEAQIALLIRFCAARESRTSVLLAVPKDLWTSSLCDAAVAAGDIGVDDIPFHLQSRATQLRGMYHRPIPVDAGVTADEAALLAAAGSCPEKWLAAAGDADEFRICAAYLGAGGADCHPAHLSPARYRRNPELLSLIPDSLFGPEHFALLPAADLERADARTRARFRAASQWICASRQTELLDALEAEGKLGCLPYDLLQEYQGGTFGETDVFQFERLPPPLDSAQVRLDLFCSAARWAAAMPERYWTQEMVDYARLRMDERRAGAAVNVMAAAKTYGRALSLRAPPQFLTREVARELVRVRAPIDRVPPEHITEEILIAMIVGESWPPAAVPGRLWTPRVLKTIGDQLAMRHDGNGAVTAFRSAASVALLARLPKKEEPVDAE